MNPALLILFALCYALMVAFRQSFVLIDLFPIIYLLILHRNDLVAFFRRLLIVQLFLLFIAVTVWLFHQDLEFALLILIRSTLIVTCNLLLFWGQDTYSIYRGLVLLRLPDKFSALFFFMLKYIDIIRHEYEKLVDSHKARGFVSRTNLFSYKTYANMVGMLIFKSLERSESLREAMIIRRFDGRIHSFYVSRLTYHDGLMAVLIGSQMFMSVASMEIL